MISPDFYIYNKDTDKYLKLTDIVLSYISNTIPGTLKLTVMQKKPNVLKNGDIVFVEFGNISYFLIVISAHDEECILVDLLTYNSDIYIESTNFQALFEELKDYMIFKNSEVYSNFNFSIRPSKLLEVLIQCNSNCVYLTALDGMLNVVEIDDYIEPSPYLETLTNSWSIC